MTGTTTSGVDPDSGEGPVVDPIGRLERGHPPRRRRPGGRLLRGRAHRATGPGDGCPRGSLGGRPGGSAAGCRSCSPAWPTALIYVSRGRGAARSTPGTLEVSWTMDARLRLFDVAAADNAVVVAGERRADRVPVDGVGRPGVGDMAAAAAVDRRARWPSRGVARTGRRRGDRGRGGPHSDRVGLPALPRGQRRLRPHARLRRRWPRWTRRSQRSRRSSGSRTPTPCRPRPRTRRVADLAAIDQVLLSEDGRFLRSDRLAVVEGRLPDPGRANELVVNPTLAERAWARGRRRPRPGGHGPRRRPGLHRGR